MYKSPYPLEVKKQTNGDIIISDGFLFWRKEIRIKLESEKVIMTVRKLFGKEVSKCDLSDMLARTVPTTEGAGAHVISGVAGVLCVHSTEVVYTKANSTESVMRELQLLKQELNNKLQIEDAA